MLVKVTKEAYKAWREFSHTDGTYREMPGGRWNSICPKSLMMRSSRGAVRAKR